MCASTRRTGQASAGSKERRWTNMSMQGRSSDGGGRGRAAGSSSSYAHLPRKVFARASLSTGITYVSARAIEAVLPSVFVEGVRQRRAPLSPDSGGLLRQLFLVGRPEGYTALLPAADHPAKPLRVWQCFYELEMDAAQTYIGCFFPNTHFHRVWDFPRVRPSDDLVIIGSQVSNASARAFLGEVQRREPLFRIEQGGWRTELHWNLLTPEDAPVTTVREFGGPRGSRAHLFAERGTVAQYRSQIDPQGTRYLDDYLLVTALPRRKARQERALVFCGLHGAGSRALDLMLRAPPVDVLDAAARQIDGAPHFQMLFRVDTTPDERGESMPRGLELVEARPLIIE
jgi:hypothetical protein